MGEELRAKVKIKDNNDMEEVEKGQDGDQTFYVIKTDHEQTFEVKQGLKSLNPRPNSLFCTNSWCPTSMQNLESVAQKMAEL